MFLYRPQILQGLLKMINEKRTEFCNPLLRIVGRDSVVGIATRYGLDGPGIESADPSGRAV